MDLAAKLLNIVIACQYSKQRWSIRVRVTTCITRHVITSIRSIIGCFWPDWLNISARSCLLVMLTTQLYRVLIFILTSNTQVSPILPSLRSLQASKRNKDLGEVSSSPVALGVSSSSCAMPSFSAAVSWWMTSWLAWFLGHMYYYRALTLFHRTPGLEYPLTGMVVGELH